MTVHEALDHGQPDAVALELLGGVHALEGAEEVFGIVGVEAGAVVAHEEGALTVGVGDADLHARRLVLRGELPGVVEEVAQEHAQQAWVGVGRHVRRDDLLDHPGLVLREQLVGDLAGERAHVDTLPGETAPRQPREAQQIVDEAAHALRGGAHALQMPHVLGPEIADAFQLGDHLSTFGGNPVSCAASLANIEFMEETGLVEQSAKKGAALKARFEELQRAQPLIGEVRGKGLMIGVELVADQQTKAYGTAAAGTARAGGARPVAAQAVWRPAPHPPAACAAVRKGRQVAWRSFTRRPTGGYV